MCRQHGDRGTCGMWNTRTWSSSACWACFHMRGPGVSSGTCFTWRSKPSRGCCQWRPWNVWGGVVPHPGNKPETRVKDSVPGDRTFMLDCEKKPGANLPGVVSHKLWRGQLCELVPHTPVHSGHSPRVVVVAQEVDASGLPVRSLACGRARRSCKSGP